MKFFNTIISKIIASREITGRARALSALQHLNDDYLRDIGYSPEKIASGLAGWPWRDEDAVSVASIASRSSSSHVKPSATTDASAELGRAA